MATKVVKAKLTRTKVEVRTEVEQRVKNLEEHLVKR